MKSNQFGMLTTRFHLIVAVLLFPIFVHGQVTEPERDNWARHSIANGDIDSVNLTNGNLGLNIPLAQLSSARGSVNVGFNLRYNSKLYNIVTNDIPIGTQIVTVEMLGLSPEGGWSYAPTVEFEIKKNGYTAPHLPPDHGSNYPLCSIKFKFSGGTTYEFLPYGSGRKGNTYTCSSHVQNPSSPAFYYSPDGSFMRMVIEPNGTRTVYFPDGGRVVSSYSQVTQILDRNGNFVQPATVTLADGTQANGWVDQVGRYIAKKFINSTEDRIYAVGFNGEQLVWTVKWKTIGIRRPYRAQGGGMTREGVYETEFCGDMRVVDEVILPSQLGGMNYTFNYHAYENYGSLEMCDSSTPNSPGFGEIKSVTLPSGAKSDFNFEINGMLGISELMSAPQIIDRSGTTTSKTLTYLAEYDGASTPQTETWSYGSGPTSGSVMAPNGSVTQQYHFDAVNDEGRGGSPYKIIQPDGGVVERIWLYNNPVGQVTNNADNVNPYVKTEFVSIPNSAGQLTYTAIKDYEYDKNGNLLSLKEYDFVDYCAVPRSGGYCTGNPTGIPNISPSRITESVYHNWTPNAADITTNAPGAYWYGTSVAFLGAVAATEIKSGLGISAARSEIGYDDPLTTANTIAVKYWDSNKGGQNRAYSNPLTSTNSISTSITYNQYGMPLTKTDANGVVTQIIYGPVAGPNGSVSDLYPTQTISAYGTPVARTTSAAYDYWTGAITTATDVDNNVSVVTEYDAFARPKKIRNAAGTPLESWVQTQYDDPARRVIVRSDLAVIGDGRRVGIQHYDQLGRIRLDRRLENPYTEDPYNEAHGIKVETRYQTANPHTFKVSSNPFRAATATQATIEATMGWTRSKSWNNGMKQEVESFSGAQLPAPWGNNTNSTGIVTTDVDADRTLITDQAGKQRISRTNALGQLTHVWEVTAADQWTAGVTFPGYQGIVSGYLTNHSHDVLDNLTTVTQGAQVRSFAYSSVSRLITASHPESGVLQYRYDDNGNLTRKTDARNIQTDYVYDELNRVVQRAYTNEPTGAETLDVTYTYDNVPNAKGKLTKITTGPLGAPFSISENVSFDLLGRVTRSKQTTDGIVYGNDQNPMTYTYNLSGDVIEQTYPSGRTVKNVLDNEGDLEIVQSKKNPNFGYTIYAENFTRSASGTVTSMQLGNGKWESVQLNSRLQTTQIALGTVQNSSDKLKLDYSYGSTQNNGNVQSQTINVSRSNQSPLIFNQTYVYDSLNRLSTAEEMTGTTVNWRQTYAFDRYGNRQFNTNSASTTTLPSNFAPEIFNPSHDQTNNRLMGGQGYLYDAVGNVVTDPEGRSFQYDAENKQNEVKNESNQVVGQYFFDGNGKRVKKYVPSTGELTIFVYDAGGKMVAEYSTIVVATNQAKVQYLTADNLGTPRIKTDQNGNTASRSDYLPYGEEIVGLGGRTPDDDYVADDVRQGFTGYENDPETGLDYAEARIYASRLGRFTGADPFLNSGNPGNPKTWNRYVYVLNNPLNMVDVNGLYECSGTPDECERFRLGLAAAREKLAEIAANKKYGTNSKEYIDAKRAVDAYGTLGDKNGVTVKFGKLAEGRQGQASGGLDASGNKSITVTIDLAQNKDNGNLLLTIAHEGSHAQDHADYQDALIAAGKTNDEAKIMAVFNGPLRITHGASETRAYGVSAVLAEFTVLGDKQKPLIDTTSSGISNTISFLPVTERAITIGKEKIWNTSWASIDKVDKLREKRANAIAKGLKDDARYSANLNKPIE